MTLSLNKYAKQILIPSTRRITTLLPDYPDAIDLTIGQPDFPTPEIVKRAGVDAIKGNQTAYSANSGLIEARESVANYFFKKYGAKYEPKTEIIMSTGSSQALDSVFRTILNEGDEVLIPAPTYMS